MGVATGNCERALQQSKRMGSEQSVEQAGTNFSISRPTNIPLHPCTVGFELDVVYFPINK